MDGPGKTHHMVGGGSAAAEMVGDDNRRIPSREGVSGSSGFPVRGPAPDTHYLTLMSAEVRLGGLRGGVTPPRFLYQCS